MGQKPETFLKRVLVISTNPGDYVLDSFLGSGTSAAVAHKMGRRYIGVEMGEQAKTHCALRLRKVIDGEQGGVSEASGWKGVGGFRFFTLGEAVFDTGGGRIKPEISFEDLAAHIYFSETKTPMNWHSCLRKKRSSFLGIHEGAELEYARMVIYGEAARLTHVSLSFNNTTFKQTPYDIKVW